MAGIRLFEPVWQQVAGHLLDRDGEHFAFLLADFTMSRNEPVFLVREVLLLPDEQARLGPDGWELSTTAIVNVVNAAIRSGAALIEAHNHGGPLPRFSPTDRAGLKEFVPYVFDSLPGFPYAATVWGDSTVYGDWFLPTGEQGQLDSVLVIGDRLRQVVSTTEVLEDADTRFDRQMPWFTEAGQRAIRKLRVAVVGASGTGGPVIQQLASLGIRKFTVVDPDRVDQVNLARIPYATPADVGSLKTAVARRYLKSVLPTAEVREIPDTVRSEHALGALTDVDLIVGCVDNDGARLVLNGLALAYAIPYLDVGVGITAEHGLVTEAGGRVALVLPGGPCLSCMDQLDITEARYFLQDSEQQELQRRFGYVTGVDLPDPAVGPLNALLAASGVNELAAILTGARSPAHLTVYDLLGLAYQQQTQRLAPQTTRRNPNCLECLNAGQGDRARISRYVV